MSRNGLPSALALIVLAVAACTGETGDNRSASAAEPASKAKKLADIQADTAFSISPQSTLDEPWAMAFVPGTQTLLITQRGGTIAGLDTASRRHFTVSGAPSVDYGGQGGLGDILFAPATPSDTAGKHTVYLSWAEAGPNDTRGAVVGKGLLTCVANGGCALTDLALIWRQAPKVTGRGHYSHRMAFSPDGRHLFIASGDRQKMTPAQDLSNTLGKIVRLTPDGAPAPGNPFAGKEGALAEIWSYGHRNILGLAFDTAGQLWDLEHGPAGGDELNLVKPSANYGWPLVSEGQHYDGKAIPPHKTRPDLAAPGLSWNPVIAPGNLMIYTGDQFPAWKGQALISGLVSEGLVRVGLDKDGPRELARYAFGKRVRSVIQGPDGALWVAEDGKNARLLKLTPRR